MKPIQLDDQSIALICDQIHKQLPKVKKKTWTRKDTEARCHLGAPEEYRARYINTLLQFKLLETHYQFIEQTLDKWLKLGVV